MIGTRGFPHPGRAPAVVLVGEPILVAASRPTVAIAKELTQRVERAIAEQAA
jgi:hypothetical protein